MNRRNFLKITVAAGIATAIPVALTKALERQIPVIYGDGIHDDTEGLQAALDGREFISHDECVRIVDGAVRIHGGTYRLSKQLHFGLIDASITHSRLMWSWPLHS